MSRDPETVILRVEERPGMPSLAEEVGVPELSLYGDGRTLVRQDFDGAYPQIREVRLDQDRVDDLLERAAAAGVFDEPRFETDAVDAGELRITARARDREYVAVVPGGSEDGDEVVDLADELRDLASQGRRYQPERMGIFFRPVGSGSGYESEGQAWPLRIAPVTGDRHPCATVQGRAARAAARIARASAPDTQWRDRGRVFTVVFRPLLPEEPVCAAAAPDV